MILKQVPKTERLLLIYFITKEEKKLVRIEKLYRAKGFKVAEDLSGTESLGILGLKKAKIIL